MKLFPLILALLLTSCTSADFGPTGAPALATPQASPQVEASPLAATLTPTVAVTPTSGAQATAYAAKATSDAAQIALVQMTAAFEHAQATTTEAAAARTALVFAAGLTQAAGTAAAAPASTQGALTQQARSDNLRSTQNALALIQATQTAEYPTQIVSAANAQAQADNAPLRALVNAIAPLIAWLVVLLFVGCGGYFLVRWALTFPTEEPATVNEALEPKRAPEVMQVNKLSGPYLSADQYVWHLGAARMQPLWDGLTRSLTPSYGNFTPRAKGFSQDEWNVVTSELWEYKFAEYNNDADHSKGMHLTQVGRDYAMKRAQASPPPPHGFTPIAAK